MPGVSPACGSVPANLICELALRSSQLGPKPMVRPISHLALYLASNNQFIPAFPVGIIAIVVCNIRKRGEIGGWLLFFYWQLYSGAIVTAFLFHRDFQTYVPENFASHLSTHRWLMAASVTTIVILSLQVAVGTLLVVVRNWDMVQLLRILLVAQFVAFLGALMVDITYFPNAIPLRAGSLISVGFWAAYFFMSDRVRHVFKFHDWDAAVETIHPMPKELSIY